jgi:hypothetical protein
VPRRVSLPGADELFRATQDDDQAPVGSAKPTAVPDPTPSADGTDGTDGTDGERRSSGRVRHDEKMTVYVTSDELFDLEHARLTLRRSYCVAVDRGRLVREAVAIVLADLAERGDDAELVRRLAPS